MCALVIITGRFGLFFNSSTAFLVTLVVDVDVVTVNADVPKALFIIIAAVAADDANGEPTIAVVVVGVVVVVVVGGVLPVDVDNDVDVVRIGVAVVDCDATMPAVARRTGDVAASSCDALSDDFFSLRPLLMRSET